MTMYKTCSEINPVHAKNPECPFNCIGCKYFGGISVHDKDDVDIECELEDN